MKIAALDSSGLVASVAIVEDHNLIAEINIQYKKTHSQTLLPMLEEIRSMVDLELSSIDAIALAAGPGSFTGLRIGSATAKGLGFALGKPLVEIPTVDGLAYNLYGTDKLVCPLMDARRNQVYTGIYEFCRDKELNIPREYRMHTVEPQCAVAIEEITNRLNRRGREVIFLGDGVPVFEKQLETLMTVPYSFAPVHMNRQRAAALAALAFEYSRTGQLQQAKVTAAEHAPIYLRLSQAERESGEKIICRPMVREDAAAISKIEEETFSMPWKLNDFLEMIEADYAYYYVAEKFTGDNSNGPIAVCGVRNILGEGQITNVAVAKEHRGRGIGGRLMKYMLSETPEIGITSYSLEVRVSNLPAIRLYEKFGFKSAGVRPDFYEKPQEDALIMSLSRNHF